jgi:trimethylamine--corrinoid protein Co-methyltransferase
MTTIVEVLPTARRAEVHARALAVLARTGLRVESVRAREILGGAGAAVDEDDMRVRLPRAVVEAALAAAPRTFSLGGRRPGWQLALDGSGCALVADGEALQVLDAATGVRRPGTQADWEASTDLLDASEEVGVYWRMVNADGADPPPGAAVRGWAGAFARFSRHVQDSAADPAEAAWLLEILDVVFGGRAEVRRRRPFSFLLCPLTPLVLEGPYTDAWLATADWGLPVAAMPMPLMGLSAPVGLLSTIVLGTAETLATLCLVQAAAPGTPFIFAPALAVMEPRGGRFAGGAPEHALLGAAVTEMARFYRLPAQASVGGTDAHLPGAQAGAERALGWLLPALAWPDLLVGPGLLGGSTVLSLEQLYLDLEVFRRCVRLRRGIDGALDEAVEDVLDAVGPGGDFLARPATRAAVRGGEWHLDRIGVRDPWDRWAAAGRPDVVDEARRAVAATLAAHQPQPLDEATARELARIVERAAAVDGATGARATKGR